MIKLCRADDRLIHGMVAVSWTNYLKPEIILVANDAAANDDFVKMTMMMAKPAGVKLIIRSIESCVKALNNPANDNKVIFLVTESICDAKKVFDQTKGFKELNIGTAGFNKGKDEKLIQTLAQVYITEKEFDCAKYLASNGVNVFAQITPSQESMSYKEIEKIVNNN